MCQQLSAQSTAVSSYSFTEPSMTEGAVSLAKVYFAISLFKLKIGRQTKK